MELSKRKKIVLVAVVALLMVASAFYVTNNIVISFINDLQQDDTPYVPSVITAENWYNVTYANITYGTNTTNIWGAKEMDLSDGANASFIEETVVTIPDSILGDAWTDSVVYWNTFYRMDNPEIVADGVVGANCLRVQFATQSGVPILRFDNNTSNVAAMDLSEMDYFNFSMKSTAGVAVLSSISFYNTISSYFVINVGTAIPTSWTTYVYDRNDYTSVGGLGINSVVNWIDFRFTNPINNNWIYIDAPLFYSNATAGHRFATTFNFTGIGPYENYALNVSAFSNVTSEYMRISNIYEGTITAYDIVGTGSWENFSISLNTTRIQEQTYKVIFINSTLFGDSYASTLDIDLFQIYAWNETNIAPVVVDAVCVNIDGDNLYAGYRNYTFTVNVTDGNGYADIDFIFVALETVEGQYPFKVGWYEDNETFVEFYNPDNVTLQTTLCSNVSAGNQIDLTFSITIEVTCTTFTNLLLCSFVNDTAGIEHEHEVGLGYDIVSDAVITGSFSDNRGNGGTTIYAAGLVYYYNSTIGLASDYYDVWAYNTQGYPNYSTPTISINGAFNITIITTTDIVEVEYEMSVRAEGEGVSDTDYSAVDAEDSYISDELRIIFTRVLLNPGNDEKVYMVPVITREFDGSVVVNYDIVIEKDGIVWKSFDESNYTTEFWDAAPGGESHMYFTDSVVDNTYDITDFYDLPIIVVWYGSRGGDGGGGDDDDGEDAWFSWDDWFDLPPMEEAPELYFIMFLVLALILFGCIACPICSRMCCKSNTFRANPFDYMRGKLIDYEYLPLILVGKKKKKKTRKK